METIEIPSEVCDMLGSQVIAKQLLSELKCFNQMTKEELECSCEKNGSEYTMKKIIDSLPRQDDWDYDLVTALRSKRILKAKIAEKFSQWMCQKKPTNYETLLVHFKYFPCLDSLNNADSYPNWKTLAREFRLTDDAMARIEADYDETFMRKVMKELAKKTIKSLLSALKKLKLMDIHKEILEVVKSGQQNRQDEQYDLPRPLPRSQHQPRRDHHQPPETAQSVDSYFTNNRKEEEEKKSLNDKFPTECRSVERKNPSSDSIVVKDQENELKKCKEEKKIESTIEGNASPELDKSVKATPIYPNSNQQQIETDSDDSQHEDNNFNIHATSPDTSIAEEMPDVAAPNNLNVNEIIKSDNTEEMDQHFNMDKKIVWGICITGCFIFITYKYLRH